MNKKKLIVNADDFGQSDGINIGIIKAHELGVVTSASLMVRYKAASEAAGYARLHPALGIGLHVDLGEWIYKDGNWETLYVVIDLNDIGAVEYELKKQLESFYRLMGRTPDHLNSHQHVHQRATIRPIFEAMANSLDITLRACSNQVNYCGHFYGQSHDGSACHDAISSKGLQNIIFSLPDGITEMACHPGINTSIETMYRIEREMEVAALCDPETGKAITEANIQLCNFNGIRYQL